LFDVQFFESKRLAFRILLMKHFFWYLLLGCITVATSQTSVSGVVLDESGQSIPFVNVYFKNSSEGTITNEQGKFQLYSSNTHNTLVISYIGYQTLEHKIVGKNAYNLKFVLKEGEQLQEVVVVNKPKKHLKKKDNPAYPILQKIWDNKKRNQLKHLDAYEYKTYSMLEVDLNHLDSAFMKKVLGKGFDSITKIIQKKNANDWFDVPIYMREFFEMVYINNQLNKEKKEKFAERITGVAAEGLAYDKVSVAYKEFDIYENNIKVLEKFFVSPLSTDAYSMYEYVLQDSLVDSGRKFYQIYFFPRQEGDLVFTGSMKVDAALNSVAEINMQLGKNTNLNMVRGMNIDKKFKLINGDYYVLTDTDFEADFTLVTSSDEEKGVYIKNRLVYQDFVPNKPKEEEFYDKTTKQISASQYEKDEQFWNENAVLSEYVKKNHQIIVELQNNKKIKSINGFVNLLTTGNIPVFKNFQLGSLWLAFNRNNVEGTRVRLGLRNYASKDDRFRINTYAAYGFEDKEWKYGAEIKYLAAQDPRLILGVSYMNDFEQISAKVLQDNELLMRNFGVGALFVRGNNFSLTHNRRFSTEIKYEFNDNLHLSLAGIYQDMTSASPENFSTQYVDRNGNIQDKVHGYSTSLTLAFTPGRLPYGFGVERKYSLKNFATYLFRYTKGFSGITGKDFDYHRLQASVRKTFQIGKFGFLNSYVEGSKLIGTVPIVLMTPIHANQTYSVVNSTFSLLNYYDLMADQYVLGQFDYHLNGLLFNRLPLIKKLKWREVGFFRTVYGTVNNSNSAINLSNIPYVAPDKRPYQEYGFGIENIGYGNLRPLRIDFTWRNQYEFQNPHNTTPKFGVLVGVKADF